MFDIILYILNHKYSPHIEFHIHLDNYSNFHQPAVFVIGFCLMNICGTEKYGSKNSKANSTSSYGLYTHVCSTSIMGFDTEAKGKGDVYSGC